MIPDNERAELDSCEEIHSVLNSVSLSIALLQLFTVVVIIIYPIIQKRGEMFLEIILIVGLRYCCQYLLFESSFIESNVLRNFIYILMIESKIFSHWAYVTEYTKTGILMPSLIRKARMLTQ